MFVGGSTQRKRTVAHQGFSLLELAIVVTILSVMMTLGLEVAAQLIGSRSYRDTQAQLSTLDQALVNFYQVYGRLPCPADRTLSPTNTSYGLEQFNGAGPNCSSVSLGGGSVYMGSIPFRTLNLPLSMSIDSYGSKIDYFVTAALAVAGTNTNQFGATDGTANAAIEVRTGILDVACAGVTNCEKLADPATQTGAAYMLISHGPDQRGAVSKRGVLFTDSPCNLGDARIDGQNCILLVGGALVVNIPTPPVVLYDSRYNSGSNVVNYFDDVVIWRRKDQL
jgi:prepilin-type N-terminal cleavage/methylation domain-containing protein